MNWVWNSRPSSNLDGDNPMMVMKNIRPGGIGKKVVTFGYNQLYWSLPVDKFNQLMKLIDQNEQFALDEFGARQLKNRPAVLDYKDIGDSLMLNIGD